MVVSVYCGVIFYVDKREAGGRKRLPHYGFCPTFTHRLRGLTRTFGGFPLGFPHRQKGKSIQLKTLCNFTGISLNEHFRTWPKVMGFSAPLLFWVYWQAIAYHQQPFSSHRTCPYTQTHTFLLFVSLSFVVSPSSFQVHSHQPPHNTPPHPPSVYVSPLALPRLFPISLLLKSETARNPTWFFFGQPRGNGSERGAQVRLQLLIKNLRCPAWRDVRNDFGFSICQSHYMLDAQAYMKMYCSVHLHTLALWVKWLGLYKIHTCEDMQERANETENRTNTPPNIHAQAAASSLAQCNSFTTQT